VCEWNTVQQAKGLPLLDCMVGPSSFIARELVLDPNEASELALL
jgi:hypothetical protein